MSGLVFQSDVEGGPALIALSNAVGIVEDGTVQTVFSAHNDAGTNSLDISFQSDVERLPEPATLTLVSLALGLLGLRGSKRQ